MILFMDSAGTLRAEMPGLSGTARRKIDLPPGFAESNPELIAIFKTELVRIQDQKRRQAQSKPDYIDPILAREERNRQIAVERAAKARIAYEKMSASERANHDRKMQAQVEKLNAQLHARSREIWTYCAESHSVQLANRVIDDPKRRPRRKVMLNGQEVSPQNVARMNAALNGVQPSRQRKKSSGTTHAVDLDI